MKFGIMAPYATAPLEALAVHEHVDERRAVVAHAADVERPLVALPEDGGRQRAEVGELIVQELTRVAAAPAPVRAKKKQ